MKTTTLSLATLLCVSLSYAGNNDLNKNTLSTPCGSFGTMKVEGQIQSDVNDRAASGASANIEYKHSSFKTSDGGTISFVKFNAKKTGTLPVPVKNLPSQEVVKNVNKESASKVSVYPNPTNGEMTIKYFIPKNEKAEFAIYDLAGKKITSYQLTGESNQIIISEKNLYAGIYFYNVISNGKIVKQDKIVIIK